MGDCATVWSINDTFSIGSLLLLSLMLSQQRLLRATLTMVVLRSKSD